MCNDCLFTTRYVYFEIEVSRLAALPFCLSVDKAYRHECMGTIGDIVSGKVEGNPRETIIFLKICILIILLLRVNRSDSSVTIQFSYSKSKAVCLFITI